MHQGLRELLHHHGRGKSPSEGGQQPVHPVRTLHCCLSCERRGIEDAEYETAAVEEIGNVLPKVDTDALIKSLKFRRSVRQYEKRPIPKDVLENVIAAAHWTATGSNHQKFRMVVVQDRMEEFRRMAWEEFRSFIRALPEDSPYHGYGIIQLAVSAA